VVFLITINFSFFLLVDLPEDLALLFRILEIALAVLALGSGFMVSIIDPEDEVLVQKRATLAAGRYFDDGHLEYFC